MHDPPSDPAPGTPSGPRSEVPDPADHAVSAAIDPAEAFALLGQEVRMRIVRALFAADPTASGDPVAFSEVADSVGIGDAGHVYYHLDALCPHFVEHTDAGYRLRGPGRRVVRLLRAGSITGAADPAPMALDEDCVRCGGGLELGYDEGFACVGCPDCGRWFVRYRFPPGGLEGRNPEEVAAALDARCRSVRRLGNAGVCPTCSGSMDRRLVTGSSDCFGHAANLRYACERCGSAFNSTVGAALADHPAVVSFLDDHGEGSRERPLWALSFAFDPDRVSLRRADPPGAEWTLERDRERLTVVVDEAGEVAETGRSTAWDGATARRESGTEAVSPAPGRRSYYGEPRSSPRRSR